MGAGCYDGDAGVAGPAPPVPEHMSPDNCPLITWWTASPLQVSAPNGLIDVAVRAEDKDHHDELTYAWTATAGTFTDPTTPASVYHCTTPGAQMVIATVSDSHRPPCDDIVKLPVTCKALSR